MGFRSFLKGGREKPKLSDVGAELELHKHFRLLRKLGRGAFATVYEAERLSDGRRYALKVTQLGALGAADKAAVVEEVRLLAALDHPNIVAYHEAWCDGGALCVVTELVGGGDLGGALRALRAEDGFLWEREVWNYFLQAALGVQYLHAHHVLHRDLKPANIMMTARGGSGLLKIADLGVSARLARVFDNVMVGTPHYMAPEMWRRQAYSFSADVWALGCILHELCTLRPTFLSDDTRTEADVARRVLEGRYDPVPTRYSPGLSSLVALMLRRDPRERPTIDEVLQLPEVRDRFRHLPGELAAAAAAATAGAPSMHGGAQAAPAARLRSSRSMERLVEAGGDLRALNRAMPPARYACGGGGVADALSGGMPRRRSLSSPDVRRLGGGADQPGAAGRAWSAAGSAAGGSEGSEGEGGGGGVPGGQAWGSQGVLANDAEEARLRRRSVMIGDLLHRLQREQAAADAAPEAGAEPGPRRSLQGRDGPARDGGAANEARAGGAGDEARRGRPPAGVARRSVAVAQVLHHEERARKLGDRRPPGRGSSLTRLRGPLEPFEFCAAAAPPGAAPATAPAQPQPTPTPATLQPPSPAAGAQHDDGSRAGGAAAGEGGRAQRKKHGRLWRLMYGDHDCAMHQDF